MTSPTEPPKTLEEIKPRFILLLGELVYHLEVSSQRVDIRERIAALALIDKVLSREKDDDDAQRAGSKVKQYERAFASANGTRRGAADPGGVPNVGGVGSAPEHEHDRAEQHRSDDDAADGEDDHRPDLS